MNDQTASTCLSALGSIAGHYGGDYLVQADCWAQAKQLRDETTDRRTREANRALALHASTYAATQAVTKAAFYRTAGVQVPLLAQLAGAVVEGVLHAVIDDGRLLRRYAQATGKMRFHDLADHGVNGRMLLDQAAHQQLQIPAGTIATVAVAAWLARRAR